MVGFRLVDERNQGLDHLIRLGGWLPVFHRDDWQTNLTFVVDVGVLNLGFKVDFGWLEGVLRREHDLNAEGTFVERRCVRDQETLPLENIGLVNDNVTEGLETCLADILELFL